MADFKVYLLHQYACNRKTNGDLILQDQDILIFFPDGSADLCNCYEVKIWLGGQVLGFSINCLLPLLYSLHWCVCSSL